MRKIKIYFVLFILLFSLNSCKWCEKKPDIKTNAITEQKNDSIPDWLVIDSIFIKDCVTYSSANIKFDTNSMFNVFPFAVKNMITEKLQTVESGMFFMVTMKRADLLCINQLAVMDMNGHMISMTYIEKICMRKDYESILFILEPTEADLIGKMDGELTFNCWGLFGSVSQKLDSTQTQNFIELVKIAY